MLFAPMVGLFVLYVHRVSQLFITGKRHNFADIRTTFNSVDYVGNQHYVFNIKGNDFRLVVVIKFTPQQVFIRFVGTHAEYDKINNISNL